AGLFALLLITAWSLQRIPLEPFEERIEAELSRSLDARVEVIGAASLSLGHHLIYRADSIAIWRDTPMQSLLGGPLRLHLDPVALWQGKVRIRELDLDSVEIDATLADPSGTGAESLALEIAIDHARLGIASLALSDPEAGRRYTLTNAEAILSDLKLGTGSTGKLRLTGEQFHRGGRTAETLTGFEAQFEANPTGQVLASISGSLAIDTLPPTSSSFEGQIGPSDVDGIGLAGRLVVGDVITDLAGAIGHGQAPDRFQIDAHASGAKVIQHITGTDFDLSKARLESDLVLSRGETVFSNLTFSHDGVTATGQLTLRDGDRRAVSGALAVDELRLPAYAATSDALPDVEMPLDWFEHGDLDLALEIGLLGMGPDLLLSQVGGRILIAGRKLQLRDLRGRLDGGRIAGGLEVDAAAEQPKSRLKTTLTELPTERLFRPGARINLGSSRSDVDLDLTMTGRGTKSMASSATGHLRWATRGGEMTIGGAERLIIGLSGLIDPLIGGDRRVAIHCSDIRFAFSNGIARSEGILIDTEDFAIAGAGEIDLGREKIDLDLALHPAERQLLKFSTGFQLTGPLQAPEVRTGSEVVLKGLANVAGAPIRPLGAIVLIQDNAQETSCAEALAESAEVDGLPLGVSGVLSLGGTVIDSTVGTVLDLIPGGSQDDPEAQTEDGPRGFIRDRLRGLFRED
ncbi:MAG: AsmA-like C-terminal region-containing protein, partial [Pseudomonadota bacterium]